MIRKYYYTFPNLFDILCSIFKTPIATHSQPSRFFSRCVFKTRKKTTSRNIKHQTLSASTKSFTGSQIRDSMSVSKPQFSWRTIPRELDWTTGRHSLQLSSRTHQDHTAKDYCRYHLKFPQTHVMLTYHIKRLC